jgi:CubicO group peptidase (beta-lactamase class C family)
MPNRPRNPDLTVDARNLAAWNTPERRRESFRRLPELHRRGRTLRAPNVLPLARDIDRRIGNLASVRTMTGSRCFCGMVVLRSNRIAFEHYASDFGPGIAHSIQSITKTTTHLMIGRLVEQGLVDAAAPIARYLPEIGTGFASATVQQALDMDLSNNFEDDYAAPYQPAPAPGAPVGYGRSEIGMGWRLPPEGEAEFGMRTFAAALVSDDVTNRSGLTQYKSSNTDVLGWIAETVNGQSLASLLDEIVCAAGIESAFHVSLDCDMAPVLSGGGAMTARDLARYGLLLARKGQGIDGRRVGSAAFTEDTLSGAGTCYESPGGRLRYRNQLFTAGPWIGHAGYAGQFLMARPDKEAAAAFFSVLEDEGGHAEGYFGEIIAMLEEALELS